MALCLAAFNIARTECGCLRSPHNWLPRASASGLVSNLDYDFVFELLQTVRWSVNGAASPALTRGRRALGCSSMMRPAAWSPATTASSRSTDREQGDQPHPHHQLASGAQPGVGCHRDPAFAALISRRHLAISRIMHADEVGAVRSGRHTP